MFLPHTVGDLHQPGSLLKKPVVCLVNAGCVTV